MEANKREAIVSALGELGLRPTVDKDGDVAFTYEMKTLYVIVGEEDEPYAVVLLPQLHSIEDNELSACLLACNKLTRELRLTKVFVDVKMQHVSAICDFFYQDTTTLKEGIQRAINALAVVSSLFRRTMQELKE